MANKVKADNGQARYVRADHGQAEIGVIGGSGFYSFLDDVTYSSVHLFLLLRCCC